MPRFSVGFNRRRSAATADDLQNVQMTAPEQSSFRVIERTDLPSGKTFDGGARLARAAGHTLPRPNTMVDLSAEDNMFADLKGNRYVIFPMVLMIRLIPCYTARARVGLHQVYIR
jgi:hypothetical protein